MPHPRLRGLLLAACLPLLLAACGSEFPSSATIDPPASTHDGVTLSVVGGTGQAGAPGQPLAEPVVVRVTGRGGVPLAGQQVVFDASGDVDPQVAQTDAQGYARTFWTLGEGTGVQRVRARGPGGTVEATAEARPGTGGRISLVKRGGDEQAVLAGALLSDLVQVAVVRDDGTLVSGAVVTFTAGQGGRVEPVADPSAGPGVATARWTLGPGGGAQVLTVTTPGADPVSFVANAMGGSGPAAKLRLVPDSAVVEVGTWARLMAVIGEADAGHAPYEPPAGSGDEGGSAPLPGGPTPGAEIPGVAPVWSSSDPAIARVDSVGIVHGVAPGMVTITARLGALNATARVWVRGGPASLQVVPDSLVLDVGAMGQLTAVIRDATGAILPGPAPVWSPSNPAVATVDAQGKVSGVAAGSAQVTACVGALCASATVRVRGGGGGGPFPSLTLHPDSLVLDVGVKSKLFPVARDSSGKAILDYTLEWSTSSDQIVYVMSDGTLHPYSAGTAVITARWGNLTASVPVRVRTPPGGSLRITEIHKRVSSTGGSIDPSTRDVVLNWWIHVSQRNVSAMTMRIRSPLGRIIDCTYVGAVNYFGNEFSCHLTLPRGAEPGLWVVDRVTVTTSTGTTTFTSDDLHAMGTLGYRFNVYGTGVADTEAPMVGTLWTYAGGRRADVYYLSVGLLDHVAGVRSAFVTVRGPGGVTHRCQVSKSYGELAKVGGGVCGLPLAPGSGTWHVVSVEVEDGAGNRATYTPEQIAALYRGVSEAPFQLFSFTP